MKLDQCRLAKAAGCNRLEQRAISALERYGDLVVETNRHFNIMSRSVEPQSEIQKQLEISLAALRVVDPRAKRWIDIGSGGGFPIIPLCTVCPNGEFTAVEPIQKTAAFLERTSQELKLSNLRVINSTAERVIEGGSYDPWEFASTKAVAGIKQTLIWSSQLLSTGGLAVTYKPTALTAEELETVKKHGFEHSRSVDINEFIDIKSIIIVVCKKL